MTDPTTTGWDGDLVALAVVLTGAPVTLGTVGTRAAWLVVVVVAVLAWRLAIAGRSSGGRTPPGRRGPRGGHGDDDGDGGEGWVHPDYPW